MSDVAAIALPGDPKNPSTPGVLVAARAFSRQPMFATLGTGGAATDISPWQALPPGAVLDIDLVRMPDRSVMALAIGLDNQLWQARFDQLGRLTSPTWNLLLPGGVQAVVTSYDANNVPWLFVLGMDNQVWHFKSDGSLGESYRVASPGLVKDFDVWKAGRDQGGNPVLFARGLDNQLYWLHCTAAGPDPAGWQLACQGAVFDFALCQLATGKCGCVAIGMDNRGYSFLPGPGGAYSLVDPGTVMRPAAAAIADVLFSFGIAVFVCTDPGSQLYNKPVWQKFGPDGKTEFGAGYNPLADQAVMSWGDFIADALAQPMLFAVLATGQAGYMKFDAFGTPHGPFIPMPGLTVLPT